MESSEDGSTPTPPVITDVAATQILIDRDRRAYLEPFMRGACSTGEAADALGVSVKDMAYRVQRMLRLHLVSVAGEQRRAGRAVRRYRAPTSFFVPFAALPEADLVEMFDVIVHPLQMGLLRGLAGAVTDGSWNVEGWGYAFELNDKGHVSVTPLARPGEQAERIYERILQLDAPAVYLGYVPLRLDFARAKELQRELIDLVQRYQSDRGASTYWIGVGLGPESLQQARRP